MTSGRVNNEHNQTASGFDAGVQPCFICMMHIYADYLDFLAEHKLLEDSRVREIKPWTAEFICHLFDCFEFPRILEIGRSHGHSFGLFRWLSPTSTVVSIDPRPTKTAQRVADLSDGPYQFINKSSDNAFREGVGDNFNLILIDGDHRRRGASRDWRNTLHVAAPGAIVIFDNLDHSQGCGVVFHKEIQVEEGSRVRRKFEPYGGRKAWPPGKEFCGTFGVVELD
jgi:predicted O-methyltransferase YrrM